MGDKLGDKVGDNFVRHGKLLIRIEKKFAEKRKFKTLFRLSRERQIRPVEKKRLVHGYLTSCGAGSGEVSSAAFSGRRRRRRSRHAEAPPTHAQVGEAGSSP